MQHSNLNKVRIAILFSNFGPYHLARYTAFFNICKKYNWDCKGIELARFQSEYPWIIDKEKFKELNIVSLEKEKQLEGTSFMNLAVDLCRCLSSLNPDVLAISGYSRLSMLIALFWALFYKKKTILFSETKESDSTRVSYRELFKIIIARRYNSALVGGKEHRDYLIKLGVSHEAIFYGYDVVDNSIFDPQAIKSLAKNIDKPYFLAINRFVPKKNLLFLIDSYAKYREMSGDKSWDLVLCGDGQQKGEIVAKIEQFGLGDVIHLPGFLQQDALLPFFAHANCFVHSSTTEQWGLVVNEAMAAGLPLLVSENCGCFADLVIEGFNGFGFDPKNSEQLSKLMFKISSEEVCLQKMSENSLKHIQNYSPDYFANGLKQAVNYAMDF